LHLTAAASREIAAQNLTRNKRGHPEYRLPVSLGWPLPASGMANSGASWRETYFRIASTRLTSNRSGTALCGRAGGIVERAIFQSTDRGAVHTGRRLADSTKFFPQADCHPEKARARTPKLGMESAQPNGWAMVGDFGRTEVVALSRRPFHEFTIREHVRDSTPRLPRQPGGAKCPTYFRLPRLYVQFVEF